VAKIPIEYQISEEVDQFGIATVFLVDDVRIEEQKLAQALHWKMAKVTLAVLNQVGKPGH